MGKNPEKTKCPECGKRKGRCYDVPNLRFVGSGFYVNDYGTGHVYHKNSKGAVDEFVENAKKSSKERMDSGHEHYKKMVPDWEVLEKRGSVKKKQGVNAENEMKKESEKNRKVAEHIYKNAKIDPTKKKTPNRDILT